MRENYVLRSLGIVLLARYCASGKIEKNKMGGACGLYGEGRVVHGVLVGRPEGETIGETQT
jgi:hypothetical protein